MDEEPLVIEDLIFDDDRRPFRRWYRKQSSEAKAEIDVRLEMVKKRNYGAHRRLARGVIELKIDFGQGLRVYGGEWRGKFFLLIYGGFKKTQQEDIRLATALWVAFTKNAHQR
jgi:putative addiction module killer protein